LNLHYHAEWTSVQAHNDCDTHSPFVAHYTGFHVSACTHRDYNRSQTTVEKIDKRLFLVRLVKTEMIGQLNKLELLAYSLVLGIGYAQQNLIANWFASRVRSFASFCRLKMLGSHAKDSAIANWRGPGRILYRRSGRNLYNLKKPARFIQQKLYVS
jgi:hypothetical protein